MLIFVILWVCQYTNSHFSIACLLFIESPQEPHMFLELEFNPLNIKSIINLIRNNKLILQNTLDHDLLWIGYGY